MLFKKIFPFLKSKNEPKVSCPREGQVTREGKKLCKWATKVITDEKKEENAGENGAPLIRITTEKVEFCETCEKIGKTLSRNSDVYLDYPDTH